MRNDWGAGLIVRPDRVTGQIFCEIAISDHTVVLKLIWVVNGGSEELVDQQLGNLEDPVVSKSIKRSVRHKRLLDYELFGCQRMLTIPRVPTSDLLGSKDKKLRK